MESGWTNETSWPPRPGRGAWSITSAPAEASDRRAAATSATSKATWCMPGPRLARKRPTGVSSPSAETSSMRPSPIRRYAASTPWSSMRPRNSILAPKSRWYVPTAASRSSTANATWWTERTSTLRSYRRGRGLVVRELDDPADDRGGVGLRIDPGEQLLELGPHERLLLEKNGREHVEGLAVLGQEAQRFAEGMVAEARLLLVPHALRVLGERVVVSAHRPRGDPVAHAVLEHHRPGQLGDALEVVRSAVRHCAEDDLLGRPAGEEDFHQVEELILRVEVAVFLGCVERVAESVASRDDRNLLHGLRAADKVGHERVAALVIGQDPLLLLGDDTALLESCDHALHRSVEIALPDLLLLRTTREDRRLVADVGEIGARQPGGLPGDRLQIDVRSKGLAPRVDAEDGLPPGEVGGRHQNLAVEPAGAEQGGVEVLEPVRRADDDDAVGPAEAVELHEQLVERLVRLSVQAQACAPSADGVQLVDEDDRRLVLARLLEQLADAGRAETREHLHEGRCALGIEVGAGCVRDGLGEQSLSSAGRSVDEDALGDAGAEPSETARMLEEIDDLLELRGGLVDAGDVVPVHGGFRVGIDLRRLHARHEGQRAPEEVDDQPEEDQGQPRERSPRQRPQNVDEPVHPRFHRPGGNRAKAPAPPAGWACTSGRPSRTEGRPSGRCPR